jgi:hypothetical protein
MIESTTNNTMLSAEQLRQKAIRQADKHGRRTAFKRMIWRYFAWISWSWVLPIVGSFTLLFLVFMLLYQGPRSSFNGFLYWLGWGSSNSLVVLEKKGDSPISDAHLIKILRVDHSLSEFSIGLLKEEELQLQQESFNNEKLSQNSIGKEAVAAAVTAKAVSIVNTKESSKIKSNNAVKADGSKNTKIEKNKEKLNKKDSIDQKNTKPTSTIKEKNK